jgi:hypothetical protein
MAPSLTRSFLVDDHPIAVSHPDLDLTIVGMVLSPLAAFAQGVPVFPNR